VFFVLLGCPNAQAYVPEMNRIAKAYRPKGWQFYLDYADTTVRLADLKRDAAQFGFTFPEVHGLGELARHGHITMSPEVAVFARTGKLEYHGRIDDRFYALGKARLAARTHDLRSALDAIDSGRPVRHLVTQVVGCILPQD